ncbi:nuclear transport factor 2 family protein [Aquincola sp. S2]|uniref:Nuclear transport factor 2 family protein n=1 Tax=Pseudaquabacterium terrae TaxID=2732868 RepID=A0ABX2EAG2_9BURK|nr:nuclear transport factor 2 family protein [Aquabacterium terrae]NRF66065.1 nuclear transport factor 2 family protein [Aquabacterium terrae]
MSTPEAALLERFYAAFARFDAEAMAACYHPQARFSDPVFPALEGDEVGDMWRMMAVRAQDFRLQPGGRVMVAGEGRADCVAHYTFSPTGRPVANPIASEFRFRDGLIVEQRDRFDFWAWSRQALGAAGVLLGWTPLMRGKVRGQAAQGLAAFRTKRGRPAR